VLMATIINYILNQYAIPNYGPYGAAIVSLITNIIVGIGYIISVQSTRQYFVQWISDIRNLILFTVTVTFGLILWNIRTYSFLYISPLVLSIYILVYYYYGYTKKERFLLLR
jgi:O-antigen/teichoic acid export membrane protein